MSNQSSMNERHQRTDEKQLELVAEKSKLEPALPPLPPLDASSSPTFLLPAGSEDPSRLDVTTASSSSSGDPMAAQIAQLFSLVGRLSSENKALKAQGEGHFSSITQLSSTVAHLWSENEHKDRIIHQLSEKVLPDGFWILEDGGRPGKEGTWIQWSKDKLRLPSSSPSSSAPAESFIESLPNELLEAIISLLPPADQASLCRTSFRFLGIAAKCLYRQVAVYPKDAALLVRSRLAVPPPETSRVSGFLSPQCVILQEDVSAYPSFAFDSLLDLGDEDAENSTVVLPSLSFSPTAEIDVFIEVWYPLLRLFNPVFLHLQGDPYSLPSVTWMNRSTMSLLSTWDRLKNLHITHSGPVPLFVDDGSSAFTEIFRRAVEPEFGVVVASFGRFDLERPPTEGEEVANMASFLEELAAGESSDDEEDRGVPWVAYKVVGISSL